MKKRYRIRPFSFIWWTIAVGIAVAVKFTIDAYASIGGGMI